MKKFTEKKIFREARENKLPSKGVDARLGVSNISLKGAKKYLFGTLRAM